MKKYIVKKELPWLSVGTVVWINDGYLYRNIDEKDGMPDDIGSPICLAAKCYEATLDYFEDTLDDNDWFEASSQR